MRQQLKLCAFASMLMGCVINPVKADYYAGALISYSNAEYKAIISQQSNQTTTENVVVSKANPYLMQAQMGYFFNRHLAIEARLGTSLLSSDDMKAEDLFSVYGKFNLPVSQRVALYALTGFSSAKLTHDFDSEQRIDGFSFGLGVHYALSRRSAVIFEFIDYGSAIHSELNAMTFGFQHRF